MITRIVKMEFRESEIDRFIAIFESKKQDIRSFSGCYGVKLLQAGKTFFTYSIWEDEAALNNYRSSDFFQETWATTKVLFAEKAVAWTVTEIAAL